MSSDSEDMPTSNEELMSEYIDNESSREIISGIVLKKGPWTSAEDAILIDYVKQHGEGNWNAVQKHSGLFRCGKSCRLRWANHLRPNLKKGAFTAEEERLIIELHSRMGNKWARMAAHLPGRTDNEIKNYWNTRIKRRQRAGLPLYPQEACLQALLDNHSEDPLRMSNQGNGHTKITGFNIPGAIFHSMPATHGALSYFPELTGTSSGSVLLEGIGSAQLSKFTSTQPPKGFCGSRSDVFVKNELPSFEPVQDDPKLNESLGWFFPLDHHLSDNHWSLRETQECHSYLNGNFSTPKPACEAVKLELPSFQHADTDSSNWDTSYSASPLPDPLDSNIQEGTLNETVFFECSSPRNSGLLDALLYEARAISKVKDQSSNKSSNSSAVTRSGAKYCETEIGNNSEPVSPLGSATSIYCENLVSAGHIILKDSLTHKATCSGYRLKSELDEYDSNPMENSTSGLELLELVLPIYPDSLEQESGFTMNQTTMEETRTETLLGNVWETCPKHMGSMM